MARATASSLKNQLATFAEELKSLRRWANPTMAKLPQPMRNELRYYVTEFAYWEKWIRCYLAWLVDSEGDPALPDDYVCPEPPPPVVPDPPEGPGPPGGGTIGGGGEEPVYYPPIADAGGPYVTQLGQVTAFDGGRTTDPDTPLGSLIFDWDFGDGTAHEVGAGRVIPTHQYGDPGNYTAILLVRDPQGQSSVDTAPVNIWQEIPPVRPTIDLGGPYTVINCTPPCPSPQTENTVTVTAIATWDVRWTEAQMVFTWNWGDGTGDVTGGRVNQHVYQLNGTIPPEGTTQTITCTIRDPAAQTAVDTAIVTVFAPLQNHAPTACYTANTSAPVGGTVEFDAGTCTTDVAGDGDCTFANNRLFYRWDYDNGEGETEELNVCSMQCLPYPQGIAPSIGTGPSGNRVNTLLGEFEARGGWIGFTLASGSTAVTDAQDQNSTTIYGWAATIQASGGPIAARRKILRAFEIQDLVDIGAGTWVPAAYDGFVYGHVDEEAAQVAALIAQGKRHFRYFTVQEYPLSTWHDTWFDWLRNTAQSTSGWNARMISGTQVGLYYALCTTSPLEYREFIDWSQIDATRAHTIAQEMWDLSPDCIFLDQCWVWGPSPYVFATQGGSGTCGPYQNASGQGAANYTSFPTSKWDTYRDNIMYFYKHLADLGRLRGKYVLYNTNITLADDFSKGIPPQPWLLERAASGDVIENKRRGMWYDRLVAKYFPAAGTYDVQVRVIEPAPCGLQDTFAQQLIVSDEPPPNLPPTAVLTGPTQLVVNTTYTWDASGSSDPETPPSGMYYKYDWDDGTTDGPTINLQSKSHRYTTDDHSYVIRLTVYDGDPDNPDTLSDMDSLAVTVGTINFYPCTQGDCDCTPVADPGSECAVAPGVSNFWADFCIDQSSNCATINEGGVAVGTQKYNTDTGRSFGLTQGCGNCGTPPPNYNSNHRRIRFGLKFPEWAMKAPSGSGQHFMRFGQGPLKCGEGQPWKPWGIRIDFDQGSGGDVYGFKRGFGIAVYIWNPDAGWADAVNILANSGNPTNMLAPNVWYQVEADCTYEPMYSSSQGRVSGYINYYTDSGALIHSDPYSATDSRFHSTTGGGLNGCKIGQSFGFGNTNHMNRYDDNGVTRTPFKFKNLQFLV